MDRLRSQVSEKDKIIAALRQAAREKDRRLDQLSSKHRREQRQYWRIGDLEPVAEVEASLEENDDKGSEMSHDHTLSSPTSTGTPSSPCSSERDGWNEFARKEFECFYGQLIKEHQDLQRSYQMLQAKLGSGIDPGREARQKSKLEADLFVARQQIRELNSVLGRKSSNNSNGADGESKPFSALTSSVNAINIAMAEKLRRVQAREAKVRGELQEVKDHNELLEFRILELEGQREKRSSKTYPTPDTRDVWTDTENDDVSDSGVLSLPTSDSTGAEVEIPVMDGRSDEVRSRLLQLSRTVSSSSDRWNLEQAVALLDSYESRLRGLEFQDEADQILKQIPALPKTDGCNEQISSLESKSSETSSTDDKRIEDVQTDDNQSSRRKRPFETLSFQESGIFEECDDENEDEDDKRKREIILVTVETQTSWDSEDVTSSKTSLEGSSLVNLTKELQKLKRIQETVEGRRPGSLRAASLGDVRLAAETEGVNEKQRLEEELKKCKDQLQVLAERCNGCDPLRRITQMEHLADYLRVQIKELTEKVARLRAANERLEEERCELEEAENDTRLKYQRMEDKLAAVNEKKLILQAELAEDKRIIAQLRNQVSELQRRRNEAKTELSYWECLVQKYEQRNFELEELEVDLKYKLQILENTIPAIVLWSLWCWWRSNTKVKPAIHNTSNWIIVPYDSKIARLQLPLCSPMAHSVSKTITSHMPTQNSSRLSVTTQTDLQCNKCSCATSVSLKDAGCQSSATAAKVKEIAQVPLPERIALLTSADEDLSEQMTQLLDMSERLDERLSQLDTSLKERRSGNRKSGEISIPERKPQVIPTINLDVAADLNVLIETLTKEKEDLENRLCDLEKHNIALMNDFQKSEEEWKLQETALTTTIKQLESGMCKQQDKSTSEKAVLRRNFEKELLVAKKREEFKNKQVVELQEHIDAIRNSIEDASVSIANNLIEFDSNLAIASDSADHKCSGEDTSDVLQSLAEKDKEIVGKIKVIVTRESDLRKKIVELEKKEIAYRETLQNADNIWAKVEAEYKSRISELEEAEERMKEKVCRLEENEQRLRQSLRLTRRGSDTNSAELLDRLMECEKMELQMKDKIYLLEKNEGELNLRLIEQQRANEKLSHELHDQEELLTRMRSLEADNKSLSEETASLQELRHQIRDLQQTEAFLRGRIEELELTETSLRETLSEADSLFTTREKKFKEEISTLTDDLQNYKNNVNDLQVQSDALRQEEAKLKSELAKCIAKCDELQQDVTERQSTIDESETSFRQELTRLRNQLSTAHAQMSEIDCTNGELKEEVETLESRVRELREDIEAQRSREERSLVGFNLQLSARDGEISEMRARWDDLKSRIAERELDTLATEEGGLAGILVSVHNVAEKLQACTTCSPTSSDLTNVASQLQSLVDILSGECSQQLEAMQQGTEFSLQRCESEEKVFDTIRNLQGDGSADNRSDSRASTNVLSSPGSPVPSITSPAPRGAHLEEELELLNAENSSLQLQLETKEEELQGKCREVVDLRAALTRVQQQAVRYQELLERQRLQLQGSVNSLQEKCHKKDELITTLADNIRLRLRNGYLDSVLEQVYRCRGSSSDIQDFDKNSLHAYLAKESEKKAVIPHLVQNLTPTKASDNGPLLAPKNFQVTRKVGSDSLLVTWTPPSDYQVTGYEIYVDGFLQQSVRSASRNKALLHSLSFKNDLTIVLVALTPLGIMSEPTGLQYSPRTSQSSTINLEDISIDFQKIRSPQTQRSLS